MVLHVPHSTEPRVPLDGNVHWLQSREERKVLCELNNSSFFFLIVMLTDFEMQDLYTYKSMTYKDVIYICI